MSTTLAFARTCSAAAIVTLALAAQAPFACPLRAPVADGPVAGDKASARLFENCRKLPVTEIAVLSAPQTTSSTSFIDVIGSGVDINVAGKATSCVIVSFSAQAFAPGLFNAM